jgi:hypothetical protein
MCHRVLLSEPPCTQKIIFPAEETGPDSCSNRYSKVTYKQALLFFRRAANSDDASIIVETGESTSKPKSYLKRTPKDAKKANEVVQKDDEGHEEKPDFPLHRSPQKISRSKIHPTIHPSL